MLKIILNLIADQIGYVLLTLENINILCALATIVTPITKQFSLNKFIFPSLVAREEFPIFCFTFGLKMLLEIAYAGAITI